MKYSESLSTAAQYLKQTIPHMVEHQVPANPVNYTLWYNYVAGHLPELSRKLDRISDLKGTYSEDEGRKLFFDYILREYMDEQPVSLEDISTMATHLLQWLSHASEGSEAFDSSMGDCLQRLQQANSIAEVNGLIAEVVAATEEMRAANGTFKQQIQEANQEISALQDKLEELERHVFIDQLTQLYNRRAFDRQLRQLLENQAIAEKVCLVLFDIDHFKSFNDEYGHIIGDRVLKRMGELLQDHCPENAICARYGGEEFAMIMSNSSLAEAADVAEKLRQRVQALRVKLKSSNKVLNNISASFGLARFQPGESIENFIDRTDQALYKAKERGRNCVEVFPDHQQAV